VAVVVEVLVAQMVKQELAEIILVVLVEETVDLLHTAQQILHSVVILIIIQELQVMAVLMNQELQVLLTHLAVMEVQVDVKAKEELELEKRAQRALVDSPFLNGYTVKFMLVY
jgi:hypothetical protein